MKLRILGPLIPVLGFLLVLRFALVPWRPSPAALEACAASSSVPQR